MIKLDQAELEVLKFLADKKQRREPPEGMPFSVFEGALRTLVSYQFVRVAFGGVTGVVSAQILSKGETYLYNMENDIEMKNNNMVNRNESTSPSSDDFFMSDNPYLRIQIKLLILLFKKAGIDIMERVPSQTGVTEKPKYNQTAFAKLIGYLTKNSDSLKGVNNISTIKRILAENKPLDAKQHQDDVNAINKCLSQLGFDWEL